MSESFHQVIIRLRLFRQLQQKRRERKRKKKKPGPPRTMVDEVKPEAAFMNGAMDSPIVWFKHSHALMFMPVLGGSGGTDVEFELSDNTLALSLPQRGVTTQSPRKSWTRVPNRGLPVELNRVGSLTVKPLQFSPMAPWNLMMLYLLNTSNNEILLFAFWVMVTSTALSPSRV